MTAAAAVADLRGKQRGLGHQFNAYPIILYIIYVNKLDNFVIVVVYNL